MSLNRAYRVLNEVNKSISRLTRLGQKIDLRKHPQQGEILFEVLHRLDNARMHQIRIIKTYGKTIDSLQKCRESQNIDWTQFTASSEGSSYIPSFMFDTSNQNIKGEK